MKLASSCIKQNCQKYKSVLASFSIESPVLTGILAHLADFDFDTSTMDFVAKPKGVLKLSNDVMHLSTSIETAEKNLAQCSTATVHEQAAQGVLKNGQFSSK